MNQIDVSYILLDLTQKALHIYTYIFNRYKRSFSNSAYVESLNTVIKKIPNKSKIVVALIFQDIVPNKKNYTDDLNQSSGLEPLSTT